jgi:hypothetical protein
MAQRPFLELPSTRAVNPNALPPDLTEFYARHEGVGLESDWQEYPIAICALSEVARVQWKDLGLVADVPEGWEEFVGFRIGSDGYFGKIVYVLDAPSCPRGSIFVIGSGILTTVGGEGPYALETSLVLASSFAGWLTHLERWAWLEPAIHGTENEISKEQQEDLSRYYLTLNPASATS